LFGHLRTFIAKTNVLETSHHCQFTSICPWVSDVSHTDASCLDPVVSASKPICHSKNFSNTFPVMLLHMYHFSSLLGSCSICSSLFIFKQKLRPKIWVFFTKKSKVTKQNYCQCFTFQISPYTASHVLRLHPKRAQAEVPFVRQLSKSKTHFCFVFQVWRNVSLINLL